MITLPWKISLGDKVTKKLLFVTTRLPWPTDNGRKVTLYNYCKAFREQYGYEVYLYSFLDATQEYNPEETPSFIAGVEIAKPIDACEKMLNLARVLFDKTEPFQTALFKSQDNLKSLSKYALGINPDVIIVDMVRLASYWKSFESLDCLKSLDMDDLFSRRYQRQARWIGDDGFLGAYEPNAGSLMKKISALPFARKLVLEVESKRMARAEEKYAKIYDNVIFVSPADAHSFKEATGCSNAFVAGMGAEIDFLSERMECIVRDNVVSFVGNMAAAANAASIRLLVNDVLPKMNHRVTLEVIGFCPDQIEKEFADAENVKFLGRVDDLRESVRSTKIYLAPIAYGSGIKTKIVEAMAMGMCVVTNSIGAEGLMVENGRNIIIEDDPVKMADVVDDLLDNPGDIKDLGDSARRYAEANHRWETVLSTFADNGF